MCQGKRKSIVFVKTLLTGFTAPPLFPSSLRNSLLLSHGNILNSLKLSFPRLNWDERGLVVIMKFSVFYYSTPSTGCSKMLLHSLLKWGNMCSIKQVFKVTFNKALSTYTILWHQLRSEMGLSKCCKVIRNLFFYNLSWYFFYCRRSLTWKCWKIIVTEMHFTGW